MATPFRVAVRQHASVADAANVDVDAAAALWRAVTSSSDRAYAPPPGTWESAVADTVPVEYAPLLAASDVAAAYAFALAFMQRPMGVGSLTPTALRNRAREVWGAFAERAKVADAIERGFGVDESDAWATASDVSLGSRELSSVERVAKLAGRMYSAMRGSVTRKVAGAPEEVYDVGLGSNVARLLASEYVNWVDPEREVVFYDRIVQRKAMEYKLRGTSRASGGPLVLALDESGSMHEGRREWSKAAAMALARVAFDEGREVAVVHYSRSVVVRPLRKGDGAGLLAMVRSFLDGGTRIGLALQNAADQVEALAKRGQGGADVVLVTDGVDYQVEAQAAGVARLATIGANLWTVAIECDIPADSPLRTGAAHYVRVGDADLTVGAATKLTGAAAR
jgi:hypothetical protein